MFNCKISVSECNVNQRAIIILFIQRKCSVSFFIAFGEMKHIMH